MKLLDKGEKAEARITYFVPDGKKDGGSYETVSGLVSKIDVFKKVLAINIPGEQSVEVLAGDIVCIDLE
jgi:hypothetical protein